MANEAKEDAGTEAAPNEGAPSSGGPTPGGGGGGLFRKQAKARLEAAEKLDTLLAITSPKLWMVLLTAIALIGAALVWVFAGTATVTIPATGILLPDQGLLEVSSPIPGEVSALNYDVGVQVAAGEAIGTITDSSGKTSDIDTQVAGTIVAQYVTPGTFVTAGQAITELFPLDSPTAGIMFVSASAGKSIGVGMEVTVSPSTAPSAAYGSIVGKVASISPLPLSNAKIQQLVGDRSGLLSEVQALGSSLEIVVTLERTANNATGYQWTSGSGPPFPITPGTLATGQVILVAVHPASVAF